MKKNYFLFCVTTSKKQHNNQQQEKSHLTYSSFNHPALTIQQCVPDIISKTFLRPNH